MPKIIAEKVSKRFLIGTKKRKSALLGFLSSFTGREDKKVFHALRDVSFQAADGQLIGIIGDNGSGKSTLLRVIAGIYCQDSGGISVEGHIITLINLRLGLNARLSMRDNIFLLGAFFGVPKVRIKEKFDFIVDFSSLGEFLDTKLYQFSEGMLQRFSFSVAIHSDPDILLLDEVFEVGDDEFRKKSAQKIRELVGKGATALLVSHDLNLIKAHCDRVIWMEKGEIVGQGNPLRIVNSYLHRQSTLSVEA